MYLHIHAHTHIIYIYTIVYMYMYIGMFCVRNLQVLSVSGTFPSLYIRENKLQGPESNPSINWVHQMGINMLYCSRFGYEILYRVNEYQREWNSILTGCATLNDRVVFASMLHVFIAKHEQEETALLIERRFRFASQQHCIFLTEFPAS